MKDIGYPIFHYVKGEILSKTDRHIPSALLELLEEHPKIAELLGRLPETERSCSGGQWDEDIRYQNTGDSCRQGHDGLKLCLGLDPQSSFWLLTSQRSSPKSKPRIPKKESNPKKGEGNLASGLSLKSYGPPPQNSTMVQLKDICF